MEAFGSMLLNLIELMSKGLEPFGKFCKENKEFVANLAQVILGFLSGLYIYLAVKKLPDLIYKLVLSFAAYKRTSFNFRIHFRIIRSRDYFNYN